VHRFCEETEVPCVLPVLDVAPQGDPDFYSLYFSPGVTLEARLLARHLAPDVKGGRANSMPTIVQVYSDATGQRAAESMALSLGAGDGMTSLRRYRPTVPTAVFDDVAEDTVLVLWLRSSEIAQLTAALPAGPGTGPIYLSSFLAPPESLELPPAWKARVTYASLFDDLGLGKSQFGCVLLDPQGCRSAKPPCELCTLRLTSSGDPGDPWPRGAPAQGALGS
jgi:hypothetical protein